MKLIEIIKVVCPLLSNVAIPIATFFYGKIRAKNAESKTIKEALCCMQRNSILKSCEDYLNRGWCSMEAKKALSDLYDSYHNLGGNSFITDMVKQVELLPNEKKEGK